MSWLDIVLVVALGWFTLSGLMAGLVREVFSLAGFVLGVVLAAQYHGQLATALGIIESPEVARVVAFIGILVAVGVVAQFIASALQQLLSILLLGWANHLGGAAFGLIKGALILDVALLAALRLPFLNLSGIVAGSGLAQLVMGLVPQLMGLLPVDLDPSRWFLL